MPTSDRSLSGVVTRRTLLASTTTAGLGFLAGCLGDNPNDDGSHDDTTQDNPGDDTLATDDDSITVFATMPALWDFVRQVAGDHMDVIDLVPVGEHGHDWHPEPGTVEQLDRADGFVYMREFASWQDDAADQLADEDVLVIEASEGIEFFDSPAEDDDEHWWMDPVECQQGIDNIADGLATLDPGHADDYEANAATYNEQLADLHQDFQAIVDRASVNEIVIGTHDSFQWWHRRYDIDVYSPVGTSPDDAASPQDVQEVEELIEAHGIEHVLYDVGEPARLAQSLAEETGADILPLSPVETQIDGAPELDTGLTMEPDWGYIDHFREINLPSLEVALQAESQ